MSASVSFGGIGSGIDTESIVTGLVAASQEPIKALQARATQVRSAVTALSNIGTSLATLKTNLSALDTQQEVNSYTASSSSTSVVVSASGGASPGAYAVEVLDLAQEQRSYSKTFASSTSALSWNGTFSLKVGTGTAKDVSVTATDTLESIAGKINAAGLRVTSSVFYDGGKYRLQIRGLDTGADNNLTFGGSLSDAGFLDLNGTGAGVDDGKTAQQAANARIKVDGFEVTRPTNQITGVIPGVTMAVSSKTTSPATISVLSDPAALGTKISSVVTSFNVIVSAIHSTAGYGTVKASNQTLSGDSSLRSIERTLHTAAATPMTTSSKYTMLADVGFALQRDGTMRVDQTKLTAALQADPSGVTALISDRMNALSAAVSTATSAGSGALETRKTMLSEQASKLDERATKEQDRVDRYAALLRKQFTAMDQSVTASNALMAQLTNIFG